MPATRFCSTRSSATRRPTRVSSGRSRPTASPSRPAIGKRRDRHRSRASSSTGRGAPGCSIIAARPNALSVPPTSACSAARTRRRARFPGRPSCGRASATRCPCGSFARASTASWSRRAARRSPSPRRRRQSTPIRPSAASSSSAPSPTPRAWARMRGCARSGSGGRKVGSTPSASSRRCWPGSGRNSSRRPCWARGGRRAMPPSSTGSGRDARAPPRSR